MVRTSQTDKTDDSIRKTRFSNPRLAKVGIDVLRLEDLQRWAKLPWLAQPERIEFHLLMLVTAGHGLHTVDFESHKLSAGTLINVRPGQMQRWHAGDGLEGLFVVFQSSALPAPGARTEVAPELLRIDEWPVCMRCPAPVQAELGEEITRLAGELKRYDQGDFATALIRQITGCVLLRSARAVAGHSSMANDRPHSVHRLFIAELERALAERPTVHALSARLGYSVSTLNRACLAAQGTPAKVVIDKRVALEAARLLVHTQAPAAQVALQLGFSEATNFSKFFQRVMGATPQSFRERHGAH